MSYIGSTPTTQSFIAGTDYFNGDGTTINFTLSRAVNSVNDIEVIVNNVEQIPSGYSVSGTTLTFSVAPSSGTSNVYVRYLSTTNLSLAIPAGTSATFNTVTVADGSAAAPSITNDGDTNTGIFFPAADTIGFAEGGAEVMRINSSGQLGIGTTSPTAPLNISGANLDTNAFSIVSTTGTNAAAGRFTNTGGTAYIGLDNSTGSRISGASGAGYSLNVWHEGAYPLLFGTSNTERARIDSSGNVGIGVTPSAWGSGFKALQIGARGCTYSASDSSVRFAYNTYYDTGFKRIAASSASQLIADTDGSFAWQQAGSSTANSAITFTQAMTLDSSGNLLVGTTTLSGSERLSVSKDNNGQENFRLINTSSIGPWGMDNSYSAAAPNGTSNFFFNCRDSSTSRFTVRSNGGLANYSANNANLSDRREKTNFAPAKSYLDVVCAIPVQTFNYIDQNLEEDAGLTLGVVAQDVQAVAPELVSESNWAAKDEPEKMRLSIYQTDLQYALMKCIQEQQALITALTTRITALENNNATQ